MGLQADIDLRTKLAGRNRLELLLFRLQDELFAINVFKVRELIQCPELVHPPCPRAGVVGMADVRGHGTLAVIDLQHILYGKKCEITPYSILLICEYNRSTQGFLIGEVEEIINTSWEEIHTPASNEKLFEYLTAVTRHQGQLVQIVDIEKTLSEVVPQDKEVRSELIPSEIRSVAHQYSILIVDDSSTAVDILKDILDQIGVKVDIAVNGYDAYEKLQASVAHYGNVTNQYLMMITDAEMPKMDGYTLTKKCREHPEMRDLYIALNTSISGVFNENMVKTVGCDRFIAKTSPNEIAEMVVERIRQAEYQKSNGTTA